MEGRAKETWDGEERKTASWQRAEKPAGRTRQAWDSDRLKRMRKKETSLERLRQKAAALEQALLQCWKETPKLLVLQFFCYQLWSAKHTGQTLSFQQHKLLEDAAAFYWPSQQGSGRESKRSHPSRPTWTEGARGCCLPFLSASFLFG